MTSLDKFSRVAVDVSQWTTLCRALGEGKYSLLSLWADLGKVRMALMEKADGACSIATIDCPRGHYPSVSQHHVPAMRLERALRDLDDIVPKDLPDERPWLDHGAWPTESHASPAYTFLPVEGDGLHQIPVGPVHAGIIEPGHFRFTANGETVVRLEERLGYVHRGVATLFSGKSVIEGSRIVGRISGDSTVAYAFAFARAVETALNIVVPRRAVLLRAIMAELERIANHVNDFGAICNDASVVALHAHCLLIRESILAFCQRTFGHRLMMDRIVPGGVATDLPHALFQELRGLIEGWERDFRRAVHIYEESPSIQDRTVTTGYVSNVLAMQYGAGGYVGRASGRDFDSRRNTPYSPYETLSFEVPVRSDGDVNARALIRVEEVAQSSNLLRQLIDVLAPGPILAEFKATGACEGAAMGEAFRGDVFVSVRLDEDGSIAHCHVRDASWFQWPLLEAAIKGNIVADFPLCNKSFNCSYSGHDM